jgi:hypothetical protein
LIPPFTFSAISIITNLVEKRASNTGRVGTKTLLTFCENENFYESFTAFAKFGLFFAKVFREKPQSHEKWYKISVENTGNI